MVTVEGSRVVCDDRKITGGLLPEQAVASVPRTNDARVLAGPGTGKTKTIVEHVVNLIRDAGVAPTEILCLTFTRAAAAGMRRKIGEALSVGVDPPEVYTLHAFALKILMQRRVDVGSGKGRARVADDWEERWVVQEDLKTLLPEAKIKVVQDRLKALAAAWETEPGVPPTVDPNLLGALTRDKERYRYVLRSELVFLLYGELGSDPDLLRAGYKHIVVDEYQDLNKCDVAVLDELGRRGAALYVAGDDDQSIYQQLRHAHPDAIRGFVTNHPGAEDLTLSICIRCDREIVNLATEVISQEVGRAPKTLVPYTTAGPGIVELLTFPEQVPEARAIAALTQKFVDAGVAYDQIMVLLRSDWQGRFSEVILDAMNAIGVPARVRTPDKSALDTKPGRSLLAHMRLSLDTEDDLAWRTALECGRNGVGGKRIADLNALADASGHNFAAAVEVVADDPTKITGGTAVKAEAEAIRAHLTNVAAAVPSGIEATITAFAAELPSSPELTAAVAELIVLASTFLLADLSDFLNAIAMGKDEEQDLIPNTVNIMTMHKAKGLDACVVFVAGAEEEIIPGDRGGTDEARRLFYVSLTRAKRALFVTHAVRRTGAQAYSGVPGRTHSRTSFLRTRGFSKPGTAFARDFVVDVALFETNDPAVTTGAAAPGTDPGSST
jgi:DNA helicase II / ATP-dependent DNA helicase PcrA